MEYFRKIIIASFSLIVMVSITFFATNRVSGQGKCLIVSDIHLTGPNTGGEFKRGDDANLDFMRNAIQEMHKVSNGQVSFIVIAGDFMGHTVDGKQKASLMALIAQEFQKVFGNKVLVIPAFGNNDTDVVDKAGYSDYTLPSDNFIDNFAASWQLHQKLGVNNDSLKLMHGAYTAEVKLDAHSPVFRFVVFNSNVICTQAGDNVDAHKLLELWLPYHLSNSKGPVWVISHIPPGGNIYSGYENTLLKDFSDPGYAGNIKFNIAGHTHFNDLRVIYQQNAGQSKALGFVRIVSSISANHDNNPAFIIADYDQNGNVTAEKTWSFDMDNKTWNEDFGISILKLAGETAAGIMEFLQNPTTDQLAGFNKFHSLDKVNRDKFKTDDREFLKGDLLKVGP